MNQKNSSNALQTNHLRMISSIWNKNKVQKNLKIKQMLRQLSLKFLLKEIIHL